MLKCTHTHTHTHTHAYTRVYSALERWEEENDYEGRVQARLLTKAKTELSIARNHEGEAVQSNVQH
jgi:hypothetical protein